MIPPDAVATAIVAAHLAGQELTRTGFPHSHWQTANLAGFGVDVDVLAGAIAGDQSMISGLIAAADRLLGGAGPIGPLRGSPFDAVRLLAPESDGPHTTPAPGQGAAPPLIPSALTLDDLSGSLLRTFQRTGDAAPGAADVPLVDYIRARVAIVAAAARWSAASPDAPTGNPRFLWVAGDLSGIQSYLYRIAAIGEGGVARRLRARSLFLQLLAEDTTDMLRRAIGLPRANVLMHSGGKFHLLLPDIPEAIAILEEQQSALDRWLLRETHGEVALILAWRSIPSESLAPGALGETVRRLETALAQRKAARFAAALQPAGRWYEAAFLQPLSAPAQRLCPSCRIASVPPETLCRRCAADTAAGRTLPAARAVSLIGSDHYQDAAPIDLPFSVALIGAPHPDALLTIPLKDAPAPGEPGGFGGHIPADQHGAALTFEQIAARGRGRSLLGYLKIDVDRLGEIFAFGFRRDSGPSFDTLPRLAAVSRLLDEFFGRRVTALIASDYRLCYQVYAGGDDVLVIGPWWETLRLALRIRAEFRDWVNNNPEITLSAGLALAGFHTPVALAATLADTALQEAKQGRSIPSGSLRQARFRRGLSAGEVARAAPPAPCVPDGGRECAALFGDLLSWDHLAVVADDAADLAALNPPRALLHHLLGFGDMWAEYRDGDPAGLRLFPYLSYQMRRTIDQRQQPRLWAWAERLTGAPYRGGEQHTPLEHLSLLARLTVLLTEGARG